MNDTKKLLEVRDLHKAYSKEGVPTKALNGITFDVLNGEYLGIMGASGSGKTTLLNCIATVIKPTSGQILLSGANISSFDGTKLAEYRGNKIGYLFQDFALLDNLTGKENIILPLSIHNIDIVTAEKKLKDIADFLGITDVLSKFPSQMSGGQKQRVAAARSLISDPDIILADEPTGALDTKSARLLMEKLQEINLRRGRTILMVTHDPNAASFCSRILFIQDGVIFHELRRKIPNETQEDFYREQFCERMLFDLLCKFHCSVRGVSLIPHCIAAGIGEKRDPFGRKHTFTYLDFRGPEVIDPQCGRHAPLGTPFRYSYFWVIRSKDDDFLATSTVFCVRLHAPAVNRFRFRPGVEITVRAVVTFEFAYFLFIHRFLPSYSLNQILSIHIKIPPNSFGRG